MRQFNIIKDLKEGSLWVDGITLKALIEFNDIEGFVIGGFVFNGRRDYSIRDHVRQLYALKQKDPAYKLVLNRIYGNSIRKNRGTKHVITNDPESLMLKKWHLFISSKPVKGGYDVELMKQYTNHFNLCHFGVQVLSMAKMMYYALVNSCIDNGIHVFYGDTDSIVIREADLPKLIQLHPNLIGNDLGQMKIEFNAEESIFLAKKRYAMRNANQLRTRFIFKDLRKIDDRWSFYENSLLLVTNELA